MPDFLALPGLGNDTYPTVYQPLLKLLSFCKLKMYLANNVYIVFLLVFFLQMKLLLSTLHCKTFNF